MEINQSLFKAFVIAEKGDWLLGGVKKHVSIAFDTREEAEKWLVTVIDVNRHARHRIADSGIIRKTRIS